MLKLCGNLNGVVPVVRILANKFIWKENVLLCSVSDGGTGLFIGFPQLLGLGAAAADAGVEP